MVTGIDTFREHFAGHEDQYAIIGGTACDLLLRYTYRRRYLRGLEMQREHFRAVTAVARRVPVAHVLRPDHPFRLDALADEIERRLHAHRPPETSAPAADPGNGGAEDGVRSA